MVDQKVKIDDLPAAAVLADGDNVPFSQGGITKRLPGAVVNAEATPSAKGLLSSSDKAKLDAIENGAEVNPTAGEIKAAYESNTNTNAFTDADVLKLGSIESSAEVNPTPLETKTAYESNADTNPFTDSDQNKLGGIEAGATADQTGAEIKTLYEGEANTNVFTDTDLSKLASVEAGAQVNPQTVTQPEAEAGTETGLRSWSPERINQAIQSLASVPGGTGDVVGPAGAADESLARFDTTTGKLLQDSQVSVDDSGNFLTPGTINGRNVAGDGSKLDTVEIGAEVNPTAGDIKTSYESNANTNVFMDSEKTKLGAIEAGAEVNPTAGEIKTAYESNANTNPFTDSDQNKLGGIEAGATADQSGAEIKALYEGEANTNAFTDAEVSLLASVEAGAQVNPQAVTQSEAEAGTETGLRSWSPERINQAIQSLASVPGGTGDVVGPAGAPDESLARFDTNTGKLLQDSQVAVDDFGNVSTPGTINGRDVGVDGGKLDTVEPGAEVNPTAGEIKTAYESNADTNAFTDSDAAKLFSVEPGAEVNPSAAQIKADYESNANTNEFDDTEKSKLASIAAGASADIVGEIRLFAGSTPPGGWLVCDGSAVSRTTFVELFTLIGTTFGVGDGSTTFNLPDLRGRFPLGVGNGPSLTNRALADSGGKEAHALSTVELPAHTHGPGNLSTNSHGGHTHGPGSLSTNSTGSHSHSFSASTNTAGSHAHVSTLYWTSNFSHNHSGRANLGSEGANNSSLTGGLPTDVAGSHSHSVSGSTASSGSHSHSITSGSTTTAGAHSHSVNGGQTGSAGSDQAHENMPPFLAVNFIIKT